MTLAIYDDGKGNCQSWEVGLAEDGNPHRMEFFNIVGYGATKEEAIDEFKKEFKRTYQDVLNMLDTLEDDMYEELMVDCMGNPIKE